MMNDILKRFGLESDNVGTWFGKTAIAGDQGELIESIDPATGNVIGAVRASGVADYEELVKQASVAAAEWRRIPAPQRGEAVRLIGEALRAYKDPLGTLVTLEMGKIKAEGDGEVQEMIDIADFAVGQSRMLYGLTMHSERPDHRMYEQWHPLGLVGIISAFNFPVAVWAWNALIATVCGNVSIWKPSPKTPLTALATHKICTEALAGHDFPALFGLFNDAGNALASQFVDDKRFPLISFTGSTPVGRHVGERVAARLGRSLLELGGNNALIVDEYANLKLAVPAIVFGAVGTAGQRCTTTRRIFVHRSRLGELKSALTSAYSQVRIGNPLDGDTLMGPLIDADSVARYEAAITSIDAAGGEIICGGKRIDGAGFYVEPTVAVAANHWSIVQQETFAPISYLIPFDDLDEAIAMHNAVSQGLSSAIFTDKLQHAEIFLSAIGSDCGIANVNIGTSGAEIGGAFGGEKDTGGGRESGSDAWKAYMRRQTNTINWSDELPLAQGIRFDL
ncbi:MAG: aldehyde dehydrogenase family protein [Pseudomonadota bacterium]